MTDGLSYCAEQRPPFIERRYVIQKSMKILSATETAISLLVRQIFEEFLGVPITFFVDYLIPKYQLNSIGDANVRWLNATPYLLR